MSTTLMAIRAAGESNTAEQKRATERKRNVLVLINQYLIDNGYFESSERLQHESGGVVNKFVAADNLDLSLILGEYEAYYEMRFDKKPKIVRKLDGDEAARAATKPVRPDVPAKKSSSSASSKEKKVDNSDNNSVGSAKPSGNGSTPLDNDMSFGGISGTTINMQDPKKAKSQPEDAPVKPEDRLLKPPPSFGGDMEMRQLANVISREIYQESPNVRYS